MSKEVSEEKVTNRQMLYKILSITWYLARQGLPFQGDGTEIVEVHEEFIGPLRYSIN